MIGKIKDKVFVYIMMLLGGVVMLSPHVFSAEFGFGPGEMDKKGEVTIPFDNIESREDMQLPGVKKNVNDVDILNVVRSVVNWVLGVLGIISLSFSMYGGFLMLTAGIQEDQYGRGWKFLKSSLVGLIIIGLSWIILSFIFWLIVVSTENAMTVDAV